MRILLLQPEILHNPKTAPEITLKNLAYLLSQSGHDVTAFSKISANFMSSYRNSLNLIPTSYFIKGFLNRVLTVIKHNQQKKYDVIIIRHNLCFSPLHVLLPQHINQLYLACFQKTPYISYIAGSEWIDYIRPNLLKKGFIEKCYVTFVDACNKKELSNANQILSSLDILRWIEKTYNLEHSKLNRISYIADTNQFNPDVKPQNIYGCKNQRCLMCVGRLAEGKGLRCLLKAFSLVNKRRSDVKLVLIGDGELKNELVQLVKREGIQKNVIFLGNIPHSQIQRYMAAAEIIIYPVEWLEGLGNVHREAMAMKKPLITGVGNSKVMEIFGDEKRGLTFQPNDHVMLAEKINLLLDDKNKREEIATNAYAFLKENHSIKTLGKKWAHILKNIV